MSVSILTNNVIGNGNGSARTFSFSDVAISKSSDLVVVHRSLTGLETLLSEGSSSTTYSVSVSSYPGTGSIDYPASGGTLLVTGESLSMKSVRELTQGADLENQGGYFADTQETIVDKLTYICQQQQEEIDRSIRIPVTDTTTDVEALQANIVVLAGIEDDISTVAAISANVTTVAGISADVTTVAGISAETTVVAGLASEVAALDAISADITTAAGISANITTVAGISADVTTVAGISANVTTVAGISANVTTVAGISADVTAVAAVSGDVTSVASQAFKYLFDDSISMADPGSGDIRYNHATPASVTQIAISNTFSGGADVSPFIVTWDDSVNAVARGVLVIRKGGSGTVFQIFHITGAITDNGAWLQIPVTHVAGAILPSSTDDLFLMPVMSGADSTVAASTTVAGIVELLTDAELITGADTTRAATAAAILALFATPHPVGETAADTLKGSSVETEGHIIFPATQVPSADANHLDDYEEGTWTPILVDNSGTDEGATYTAQVGTYTKTGNIVHIQCRLTVSGLGTLTTGEIAGIGGLPFTSSSAGIQAITIGLAGSMSLTTAGHNVAGFVLNSGTRIDFRIWDATTGVGILLISQFSATGDIVLSASYCV